MGDQQGFPFTTYPWSDAEPSDPDPPPVPETTERSIIVFGASTFTSTTGAIGSSGFFSSSTGGGMTVSVAVGDGAGGVGATWM